MGVDESMVVVVGNIRSIGLPCIRYVDRSADGDVEGWEYVRRAFE